MEKLVELGLAKSIGVSNCTPAQLMDMMTYCKIKPVVNQIELHPYLVQKDYVDFMVAKFGVLPMAYASLGANTFPAKRDKTLDLFKEKVILDIAEKHGKTPAQILLNWALHRGHIIIPKTATIKRLPENFNVFDFKLSDDEYKSITDLDCGGRAFEPKTMTGPYFKDIPFYD